MTEQTKSTTALTCIRTAVTTIHTDHIFPTTHSVDYSNTATESAKKKFSQANKTNILCSRRSVKASIVPTSFFKSLASLHLSFFVQWDERCYAASLNALQQNEPAAHLQVNAQLMSKTWYILSKSRIQVEQCIADRRNLLTFFFTFLSQHEPMTNHQNWLPFPHWIHHGILHRKHQGQKLQNVVIAFLIRDPFTWHSSFDMYSGQRWWIPFQQFVAHPLMVIQKL